MITVYAGEDFPQSTTKSLFLAGPSPRQSDNPNWRIEALRLLEAANYDGVVFIPLPRDGGFLESYNAQADWEQSAMNRSDVVVFWVPRDLTTLPGFTTNIEFGQKCENRNVVLGYPLGAPKCRFLGYLAERNFVTQASSLEETLASALEKIGEGAPRTGGECEIPLYLWRTAHFASWLNAQKAAGNRLDGCSVELTFGVGPRKAFLLYWAAHVNIYVAAEGRNKSNEIVVGRPDIKHTVGFAKAENWRDTKVILVREFRSTASTGDCFVREVPGGSGFKPASPKQEAAKEFMEETGIAVTPSRLRPLLSRQLAATTTAHKAYVFAVELTPGEIQEAQRLQSERTMLGNTSETEQTYVEVYTVGQLLDGAITDWSNLGMIFAATNMGG